jgi:hypothetical protein
MSGCDAIRGAAGSATTTAPVTPVSTSTATPTPTSKTTTRGPAPVPSAAKQKSKSGAAGFTKFFLQQFNRSQTEANPALLRPLYVDACKPCVAYTDGAQALKDHSQRYADPPFAVGTITADTLKGDASTVLAEVNQQAARVVDANGATVATATPRESTFLVTLTFDQGWRVSNIEIVK